MNRQQLRTTRRKIDRSVRTREISCGGLGCNGCCRGDVIALPIEVRRISGAMNDSAWGRVRASSAAVLEDSLTAVCALLDPDTGGCSVYNERPLVCRDYGVVSPRDWCFVERVGDREIAKVRGHRLAWLVAELKRDWKVLSHELLRLITNKETP